MAGWKLAIDSAYKIGLFIHLCGILIAVWKCILCQLKQENIPEMGLDFDYIDADSGDMVEWTSAIDLVYQIGLFICSYRILIVVGGTLSVGKKRRIGEIDHVCLQPGVLSPNGCRRLNSCIK